MLALVCVIVAMLVWGFVWLVRRAEFKRGVAEGRQQPLEDAAERREEADRELGKPLPSRDRALDRLARRRLPHDRSRR